MNLKSRFDFRSVRFKLWASFLGFALLLIALIWFLQIFFLNNYYKEMKVAEATKLADSLIRTYETVDHDLIRFTDELQTVLPADDDLYVRIQTNIGDIVYSPDYDGYGTIYKYGEQIQRLQETLETQLARTNVDRVSTTIHTSKSMELLAYACYLERPSTDLTAEFWQSPRHILFIFTPLYPIKSTVSILREQLAYITVIAILLALLVALYLSRRISRPIRNITTSAAEMGKGNYGVKFQGGSYSEITELAETLTHASQELEKTDLYQRDLIANVSHDLRTPLTMIRSYAEMIMDLSGNDPEKREAHLQVIIDETNRLNTLVSDMLNMSKMQSRTIEIERADFDICEAARSLLASYDILCEQEGYQIRLTCPASLYVNGDEAKIKQVLSNLVNNAVKYCGSDKVILINLKKSGRKIRCEVTDHGAGIAPDEISHVWERYYKSSTHHVRPTDGSGLGLSIVKEILILHKANYGVNSKVGKGSTFWFEMDAVKMRR